MTLEKGFLESLAVRKLPPPTTPTCMQLEAPGPLCWATLIKLLTPPQPSSSFLLCYFLHHFLCLLIIITIT